MDQITKDMRKLIDELNKCTKAYNEGHPYVTDEYWDHLYFELKKLEEETGLYYPDSPTQKIIYEKIDNLNKKVHDHLMLSLDKTKDSKEIEKFLYKDSTDLKCHEWLAMFKMDGLTATLHYRNGILISAETRGNGYEGEDILHNVKVIKNIPKEIPYKGDITVDGEIICTFEDFEPFKEEYKNPRNFSAGSIRLLDNKESQMRNLSFIAWDLVSGFDDIDFFWWRLEKLDDLGFETVPRVGDAETVEDAIDILDRMEEHKYFPIDGYVFKFESVKYGKSLGQTEHHFNNAIAFKFYDDEYETKLKYIDYDVSRTGILTPVAVFEPIEIDGSIIERASLHNINIMEEILGNCAYLGQKIWVIKSNMIIPQITRAEKHNYNEVLAAGGVPLDGLDVKCPICGTSSIIKISETGVKNLYCPNEECPGKLAQRIDYYCGKKGLDIKGLSKKTIEKLINWSWINELGDIYKLRLHQTEWESKSGFGKASVSKILDAIDAEGRHPKLESFISALGIPLVGSTIAKTLAKEFSTWQEFRDYIDTDDCFFDMFDGIGEEINNSLKNFDYTEADEIAEMLEFKQPEASIEIAPIAAIKDKVFCITGSLKNYSNRTELKIEIESLGGKVVGAISSKVNYLITNTPNSGSQKNKDAIRLGISIISEDDYIKMKS